MKNLILFFAVLVGYFFPFNSFSTELFLISVAFTFVLGIVFPDMMNSNSLSNKIDREKVSFKSKISIYKTNTISFWIGVFVFSVAVTSVIKYILLNSEINQLSIIILSFSLGVSIKLLNFGSSVPKLSKQ